MDLDRLRTALSSPRHDDAWGAIQRRLGRDPEAALGLLIPRAVVDTRDPNVPPDPETVGRLRNAATVLVRLASDPDANIGEADRQDLLLLSYIAGRPALAVRDGTFVNPPPQWDFLCRKRIDTRLPAVGRIDAPVGKPRGTGFVVQEGVIMTNRHVVELLVGAGSAVIDFDREEGGGSRTARIVGTLWVSDIREVDLALLRIEGDGLPTPLRIPTALPDGGIDRRLVYAIGYPGVDTSGDTPDWLMAAVFRGALGIKRVQPGLLLGFDAADPRRMRHDCSTLNGSSGSCILDYTTGLVVGLHYAGVHARRNRAVALWTVAGLAEISPHITPG